jgi:tripartite ATP-independent transporter DctM subunit
VMELIWVVLFFSLILIGVPVSISLGAAAVAALAYSGELSSVPLILYRSVDNFLLLALPLFMLAGNLMDSSGMARRIFAFTGSGLGWMRGGVGHSVVGGSMIFGGISGSAAADAAALGPMSVNAMEREGYPRAYGAALVAGGASLDILIPPSVVMIVYAVLAGQSITGALVAGAIPGLLGGALLLAGNYAIARRNGWGTPERFSAVEVVRQFRHSFFALLTPVIILGGFISGYFTPTEAAGIAVLYTFLVGVVIYREQALPSLGPLLVSTARTSGAVLFLIATASLSGYVLISAGVPAKATDLLVGVAGDSRVILISMMVLVVLLLGLFMEGMAAVVILTPTLLPAATAVGIDPLHFGVVLIASLSIGLMTPPVGVLLFVLSGATDVPLLQICRAAVPVIALLFVNLVLVTYIPALSLWPVEALLG